LSLTVSELDSECVLKNQWEKILTLEPLLWHQQYYLLIRSSLKSIKSV